MPSSLAVLLPPALGSSPHPPVSVYGTGMHGSIAAFPGTRPARFATCVSPRVTVPACPAAFLTGRLPRLHRSSHSRPALAACVPTVLAMHGAGISTCCPSATHLCLALGPDLPRADQLYPGNLGYSAGRIPTFLSLLIPAFSLPGTPRPLTVPLPCASNAPLPVPSALHTAGRIRKDSSPAVQRTDGAPGLRRCVSAPDIFGAGPLG